MAFIRENINPKKRLCGDCSTRALSKALNCSYEDALKEQFEAALRTSYGITDSELIDDILIRHGFTKVSIKPSKGETRPTPTDVAAMTAKNKEHSTAICRVSHHLVACTNGNVYDTWDSSDKGCYTYWIK